MYFFCWWYENAGMNERLDELVRVDATGTAHPVGRSASRELRSRQGAMRLLSSPEHVVVLRSTVDDLLDGRPFWMTGELTQPGALWDLIGMFGQGNWTGELVVVDDSRRRVFFDQGSVVGANSSAERERLGEVLYQYGALSAEQVQIVVDACTPEVRFGEAAVALGFLSPEKLFELIGKQTEEILYAAMLVAQGSFYFIQGFDEAQLPYRLNLAVPSLLMEGVRRMDEMSCFRARIPSSSHVPVRVAGQQLPGDHEHFTLFEAIDGNRAIDDIGRVLGLGQFETTRAIFQLVQQRAVTVNAPRPTGPVAIVLLFNQAIELILRKVDAAGGGRDVREQLASFATASGVYDALFRDAGPSQTGVLEPEKIGENIEILVGRDDAVAMLSQWLYEYASFAMFIAEPLLRVRRLSEGTEPPSTEGATVSRQVADLLKPLVGEPKTPTLAP